jgi:hypothetical protein
VRLGSIFRRTKKVVDDRGGVDALTKDAQELAAVAKGKGSASDKAKAASAALKDPGAPGGEAAPASSEAPGAPGGGKRQGGPEQDAKRGE